MRKNIQFISQSDLGDLSLKEVPVRKGCWATYSLGCGCIGHCEEIVGYVDRKELTDFISTNNVEQNHAPELSDWLNSKLNPYDLQ